MSWIKRLFLLVFIIMPLFLTGCISFSGDKEAAPVVGGVFKTIDEGETWVPKSKVANVKGEAINFHSLDVYALRQDPQDANTLYAGTTQGLFYSYDFGESWHQARGLRTGAVYDVAVHPEESCRIYASTNRYLYESKDCGRTFEYIYSDDAPKMSIGPIYIDEYNPDIIYFGTITGDVIKSVDGGKSWRVLGRFKKPIEKIIAGKDTRNIYVGVRREGVIISEDGGNTWGERAKESVELQKDFDGGARFKDMAYSAENNTLLVANEAGILKSTDDGETWEALSLITSPNATIHSIAIHPNNPKRIYYGTQYTLNYSNDGGNTWVTHQLPTASRATDILIRSISVEDETAVNNRNEILVGFRKPVEQ